MNPYNSTFIHSFILLLIQNWTYTFEMYTVLQCKIDIIGLYGKIIKVSVIDWKVEIFVYVGKCTSTPIFC